MLHKKMRVTLIIMLCAFLLPMSISAKKQPQLPFRIKGTITVTITGVDWTNGLIYYSTVDTGESTHGGRFENSGSNCIDLSTGLDTGRGTAVYANGDLSHWTSIAALGTNRCEVTFAGGTGRYATATGGFVSVVEPADFVPAVGASLTTSYAGSGWVTF